MLIQWRASFYGFVDKQAQECLRFDEDDLDIKDRWDDSIYNKVKAMRYFSIIRRNGGHVPTMKELSQSKKKELIKQSKEYFWCISESMNKIKKKRMFRREFMGYYYERMAAISRFVVQAIPALKDERNNMSMNQLCGLFQSDLFSPETITSYADENSNGAKYLCELLEMEDINIRLDRMVVILTTGEYHNELTEDEQRRKVRYDDYINSYPISEVWGTYHYLAREIAPRLKAFKAIDKHGWPEDFESQEDWNKAIQKMIDAFELVKDYSPSYEEDIRTVEQGVELFCKYYRDLSD